MSSPHVAGAAALLLSANPSLSFQQVKDCLVNNADSISTDENIGNRLNVLKTLQNCSSIAPIPILPTATSTPIPTVTIATSPAISTSPIPTTAIAPPVVPPAAGGGTSPDPNVYYACHYDPVCANGNNKAIQICPLICNVSP